MKFEVVDISRFSEDAIYWSLANKDHFFYLDSADKKSKWADFAFMGFEPFLKFSSNHNKIQIQEKEKTRQLSGNPFDILDSLLKKYFQNIEVEVAPFWGGAVGYISYEAAGSLKDFPFVKEDKKIPGIIFGFYNKIVAINKRSGEKHFIYADFFNKKDWIDIVSFLKNKISKQKKLKLLSKPESNLNKREYLEKVKSAKKYIYEGDIYQVNLSYKYEAKFLGSQAEIYQKLRKINPGPFGAYLNFGDIAVYSSSPERFIKIQDGWIQTRPIKGTIAKIVGENEKQKRKLLVSEKDRAELMMIVDLERNDLGRICKYSTVSVPELVIVESYKNLFHLVSTIEGKLKDSISNIEALKEIFPGGSITGAPKIRAMRIISELENTPRNIYTGCIGYLGFNGNADFNIAIRTMYSLKNMLYFHTGGGIVADSVPELEWEETKTKAKAIFEVLGKKI